MKVTQPFIDPEKIQNIVQAEPVLVILGLSLISYIIYKFFLGGLSLERHRNLRRLFVNLLTHIFISAVVFSVYAFLTTYTTESQVTQRMATYFGFITILSYAIIFIKTTRILVFEYLFINHMKAGVPLLIVNLVTLVMSLSTCGWILTEVFSVRIAPLLATSAIFSIILGLAIQDTLGNLFAGIALQIDKPYEIDDWLEVYASPQKWVGKVTEITWRATVLEGLSDEIITIPNRVMGQGQISNFSSRGRPIIRSLIFRVQLDSEIEKIKTLLVGAAKTVQGVLIDPTPRALVTDTSDSWLTVKIVYFIYDYGNQWNIADMVLENCMKTLSESKISLAHQQLDINRLDTQGRSL